MYWVSDTPDCFREIKVLSKFSSIYSGHTSAEPWHVLLKASICPIPLKFSLIILHLCLCQRSRFLLVSCKKQMACVYFGPCTILDFWRIRTTTLLSVQQILSWRPVSHWGPVWSHLREDYLYQIRWIFGKLPNGLWPPPHTLFSEKNVRFCPGNRCP